MTSLEHPNLCIDDNLVTKNYVILYKQILNRSNPAPFCLFSFFSNILQKRLQRDPNWDCYRRIRASWPLSHDQFLSHIWVDCFLNLLILLGSGCGSVGRAVAFNTRGPWFDSSHRQNFIEHLFIINCIEKTKINKKEAGNGPLFFKKKLNFVHLDPLPNKVSNYKNFKFQK